MLNAIKPFFYKASNQCIFFLVSLLPVVANAHPGHSAQGSFAHAAEHGIWLGLVVLIFVGLYSTIMLFKAYREKRLKKAKI